MFGELSFKNQKSDLFNLNILDVIKQLKSLKDVNFTLSENGRNYIDVIAHIYDLSNLDEDAVLLLPSFRKVLREISSDAKNLEIFKELGATELDVALIQGNINVIRDYAANNAFNDPFNIAKEWRMLNISKDIITQDNLTQDPFYGINVSIGDNSVSLGALTYQAFNHQKSDQPAKNILIDIQNAGGNAWSYDQSSKYHSALAPSFDKVVTLGSGSHYLLDNNILKLLNQYHNKSSETPELDFALVILHMHDSQEQGALSKIVKQMPHNIAKETVYIISSCYSGQYHNSWDGEAHLITSSSADTSSNAIDFDKIVDLPSYWQGNKPSLKGLLQFYGEQYKLSTPHYSGTISGVVFNASPVKDAVTFLWSNEHDFAYLEEATPPAASQTIFTGLTDLLLSHDISSSTLLSDEGSDVVLVENLGLVSIN